MTKESLVETVNFDQSELKDRLTKQVKSSISVFKEYI